MAPILYKGTELATAYFGNASASPALASIITDKLVLNYDTTLYVSGSSTIMDLSGFGNTGTLNNGVNYLSDFGGILDFSGSFYTASATGIKPNISVAANSSINDFTSSVSSNGISAEIWMNIDNVGTGVPGPGGTMNFNRLNAIFSKRSATTNGYFGAFQTGSFTFRAGGSAGGAVWTTTPQTGSWQQIVFTTGFSGNADSGSIIYQNGVSKAAEMGATTAYEGTGSLVNNNASLLIGDWNPAVNQLFSFDGKIAIFRLYRKKLTESEVKQNFELVRGKFGI
jgi:hypothetical protein